MQRFIRILGVALMVVFALSAVVSATASAEVVGLPQVAETWKGESGKGTLETLPGGIAKQVVCQKDKSEGTFEEKKPLGTFHIDFEGCASGGGLVPCTGLGEAKEVILSLGTAHLVFDTLGRVLSEAGVGVLFLVEDTHFLCEGLGKDVLLLVLGEVLCLIKPVNTSTKHFEIVCELQNKGDPKETEYWNETGTKINMGLNGLGTSENEGSEEMSGELTTALILTVKNYEIMT